MNMEINENTVNKLAHLARLEFSKEENDQMQQDLQKIITWVDKLQEVDTDNIEPLNNVMDSTNVFREDKVVVVSTKAEALSNAPNSNKDFIKVPKVL